MKWSPPTSSSTRPAAGTRLPVWLEKWGYERPREETVDVGIAYASHQFRIPDGLLAEKVVVAGASREQPVGIGMLFYEDGNWNVTTFGIGKGRAAADRRADLDLADEILPAHVSAALRQGTPLGEMAFHKYPTSRWRRYDKLDRFPAGIIPFGDAVVSFNPTFGQGMTMTAIQAGNLRDGDRIRTITTSRATRESDGQDDMPVWMMTAIGDLALHNATDREVPRWYKPVGGLFDQFLGAAETDPVLAEWFSAPVQSSRQPVHGPVARTRRPHHPAQHAAVAGRAPSNAGRRAPAARGLCGRFPVDVRLQVDHPRRRHRLSHPRLGVIDDPSDGGQVAVRRQRDLRADQHLVRA